MSDNRKPGMTYKEAGVDIDAQERALSKIKRHLASTKTAGVLSELGSFGGLFRVPEGLEDPVLVSSVDGVGTKVLVAQRAGRHDTIGACLVNHCVNDILVMGARPLFFLDYLAVGKLDAEVAEQIVSGVASACRENGCALVGGETAEMPEIYGRGHYDLAGTVVGIVSRSAILDADRVIEGDRLYGIASSGLHTNGYTLARRILLERMELADDEEIPGVGETVTEALLRVHRSYLRLFDEPLLQGYIKALAHITGGGLTDNLPRVLPDSLDAVIDKGTWPVSPIFTVLARAGEVPEEDMLRTFNMGIGMVAVVGAADAPRFEAHLEAAGERYYRIGTIAPGSGAVRFEGALEWGTP